MNSIAMSSDCQLGAGTKEPPRAGPGPELEGPGVGPRAAGQSGRWATN